MAENKYVTFRDLRTVKPPAKAETAKTAEKPPELDSSTSTSSITSTPSISSSTSYTSTPTPTEAAAKLVNQDLPETSTADSKPRLISPFASRSVNPRPARAATELTPPPSDDQTKSNQIVSEREKSSAKTVVRRDEVAPSRDFQKVPNSVTRHALPEGIFRGKSKQVWDYLWSVSRGAIVPTRTVRRSRKEIKSGSGLGSMVTVDAAIEHLSQVGLLIVKPAVGSLNGNEYEVFTPDEAAASYTSTTSTSRYTSLTQKLVHLDVPESSISSTTQTIENKGTSGSPKTFFKTEGKNDDDEENDPLRGFSAALREATKRLTDSPPKEGETEAWNRLAEVIVTELNAAAARTETISSVPAFLTAHLKRRFAQSSPSNTIAVKPDGKTGKDAKAIDRGSVADAPKPTHRLTDREKRDHAQFVAELLAGGYTPEAADKQFSASFHADDWREILDRAVKDYAAAIGKNDAEAPKP